MNFLLLTISILIYASFGFQNLLYILFSLLFSFFVAKHIKKNSKYSKLLLIFTVMLNAIFLLLIRFKQYTKINVFVPIGVSYYTLQIISYLVDVYKGKYKAETNILYYSLYIMYIPHLFIGPITRI